MTSAASARQLKNADRLWHLQQSPLFTGLSWRDLRILAEYCGDRIFDREEVIYDEGDPADEIYILSRGYVRLSMTGPQRHQKIIAILKSGDTFGDNVLAGKRVHRTRAVAHEECWVTILARKVFLRTAQERPVLLHNLIRILTAKLSGARDDIEALSCLNASQRVALTLLRMGKEHGKPLISDPSRLKLKIALSHQQLASITGGNRPHISTIMSRFKRQGLVDYQGRKLLLDTQRLSGQVGELPTWATGTLDGEQPRAKIAQ